METERAGHEAEERLKLAPLSAVHQTENLITKLQNGNQLLEVLPQSANGDASWNHFKPSVGVNQMKRYGEKCSSPAGMHDLFDESTPLKNGGIKHTLSEPSLFGCHQSKKLKVDSELNGEDNNIITSWDKTKSVGMAGKLDCSPDLSKPTGFDCDDLQEQKLDKKNENFSDEDVFSLSRNKQLAFSNGATVTSPSTEDTHDDLLEKTLSQYYPDHVSNASQSKSEEESSKSLDSTDRPGHTMNSPSLTSGLPISSQDSASIQEDGTSPEVHGDSGYNALLAADKQLQQGQPLHLQEFSEAQKTYSQAQEGQIPGMDPSAGSHQNGTEGFSDNMKASSMHLHLDEEFSQSSYPRVPLQTEEADRFDPFTNEAMARMMGKRETESNYPSKDLNPNLNSQMSQNQMQIETPGQTDKPLMSAHQNHSQQGSPSSALSNQPTPQEQTEDIVDSAGNQEPETPSVSFKGEGGGMLQQPDHYAGVSWIDLNSSHPPQAMAPPQAWKDISLQPQQEHQTDAESQRQMQNLGPMKGIQMKGFYQSTILQQDEQMHNVYKPDQVRDQVCSNTRPEWQQPNSNPPPILQEQSQIQPNKMQHISPQYGTPQQQFKNQFHTKTQHFFESTQDIEQILESRYSQQQKPLPTPQSEAQLVESVLQEYPSQNAPSVGKPQDLPQDPSERQLDSQILNRLKLEEYTRLERELKSSNCKSQSQQVLHKTGLNLVARNPPEFLGSSLPTKQNFEQNMFPYGNAEITEGLEFNKPVEMQQPHYAPSPDTQKQYSKPQQIQPQSNHTGFPHPQPPTHPSPQVPQGAFNQQATSQMYPKAESQESCAQNQNYTEFQKHAALRMHLLQRQEKQGHQQNLEDFKHILQAIKREDGRRSEPPMPQQDKVLATPSMRPAVKQEHPQMTCEQMQQKSIIATMEQQLKQYQLSPVFERKSLVIKSPNKVKVETSGPVTILSTNADLGSEDSGSSVQTNATSVFTPTKKMEPNLNNFLESPMKMLDTPIKNLLDTPVKTQYEFPSCHCVEQLSEKDEGPYYTHLGTAPNVAAIRDLMEKRSGLSGSAIRIEKVVYTGKEGKSIQGCPIAKWVIRRASVEEKLLVLVRERAGHTCNTATIVVVILIWEGIPISLADRLYTELSETLTKHGALTNRRCALNEERTCACQGLDPDSCGASFSFGCSWSMYYNGCKFARSKAPRKFKLLGDDSKEEEKLEQNLQNLATLMAPTYKQMAPDAYANQVDHEHRALDCRLGLKEGRPFSGVTACVDFCAHAHRDLHNMPSGSTVVCTLTREDNREIGKIPEDEQLHVLPLYKVSSTDEFGSMEGQQEKIKSGAIQVLSTFRRRVLMLAEPAKSCRQRKLEAKRGAANKLSNPDTPNSKAEKAPQASLKQSTYENTGQNIPVSGPKPGQVHMEAPRPGHQTHPLSTQQQQLQHTSPNAVSPHPAQQNYPRFPNHADPFSSTSQSNVYPQSPAPMSPYLSTLHVNNTYLNGSNPANSYPGPVNQTSLYPGYQCNGSITTDNLHPYYASSPKHFNMYPHQRPPSYPQQQYSAHPQYGVNYPSRYGEHRLQVNGYSNCNMRPSVHPIGPYPAYCPNREPDPKFLEAVSRPPSAHPALDYAAVSKSSQYNGYPNPYLTQNSQMFPPEHDPFRTPVKSELNLHDANGMTRVLPPPGTECLTPTQPGFGLPNGNIQGPPLKQETPPAAQNPNDKGDMWSDNEHNFLDPDIGGVAVAPSHGSILIECAKRELHATTPVKNPDRNHPTRISLVFYQHKNMNEAKHGLSLWEAKMAEKAREKEDDAGKHGAEGTTSKNKKAKREHSDMLENGEPPYKRFIQTLIQKSMSSTTNTYVSTSPYAFTKVTGPYNQFT